MLPVPAPVLPPGCSVQLLQVLVGQRRDGSDLVLRFYM